MAASYIRTAEEELSCPVCFELFVDPNTPKTLPACGHVCCVVCLKKMAAGMCDKKCPECRKIVSIPKDGVSSFLTNFRLRTLADNHWKIADGQIAKPTVGSSCPVHEGEKMRLYCTTCNVLTCQLCMIQEHKGTGHNIDGVEENYSRQKVEMCSSIEEAVRDIQNAKDTTRELETRVELELQSRAEAEKEIDNCMEAYMNKVLQQRQSLKFELHRASQNKMAALQHEMDVVKEKIQSAESSHRDATNALENKPDYEYVTQHASLIDKLRRLGLEGCVSRIRNTPYAATRFEREISQDMTLGHIVKDKSGQGRKTVPIQTLDGFEWARHTAGFVDGLVLAVCDLDGKNVIIYHKASNDQYEKSHVLNLRSSNQYNYKPTDVVICSNGRFLVARRTCIEVYTPEGNYLQTITTTTTGKSGTALGVFSVTTMSDGRILAGDVARSVITKHSPTGNIVRTIATKIRPFYITLIRDTHIAMSDWKRGKVSVVDMQSGQETLSIDIPMVNGICYDEQTDCLLTVKNEPNSSKPGFVRPNTGVIEQYCCTTGRLVACLAKGLYYPHGIGFLSVGILAVADRKTVKLYTIE